MSVLITLKSIYNELPEAERKVADYFIRESEMVPRQSVSNIAEEVGVSVPSVTRLTRKLGFESFKDFKVEMAVNTAQTSKVDEMFSQIEKGDSDEEIIEKVFLGNMKSLEETLRILDKQQMKELAKQIANASRVLFVGEGGSGNVAKEAALRFSHINIQAEAYLDGVQMLLHASRLKSRQICIGISHTGRTIFVEESLKIAKEKGATTALITNYINTPMKDCCDYVLHTSFVENTVKAAAISSVLSQLAIINGLYLLTAKKKRDIWDCSEIDRLFERLLKSKSSRNTGA